MKRYYLGIDTSCYTTSCALIDESGHIVKEARKLLEVKLGQKGLQQSNMVFQHTKALPKLLQELPNKPITAIGVSAFPRREENSYMPAFLVGKGTAASLGHFLDVPVFEFAHQENHILAALRVMKSIPPEPFLALHLSGGTTELVLMEHKSGSVFESKLIGGTKDLQGGQFVDRVGVALGLSFPCGKALEELALKTDTYAPLPSSVKEGWISFAGPCSEAMRRINSDINPNEMARSLFSCIGNSLDKMISYHLNNYPVKHVIAVGGVMSNSILRNRLKGLCKSQHIQINFAEPQFSVDNATGNAYGALLASQE